jgi:DNA-binding IscR family transcriptional regulator
MGCRDRLFFISRRAGAPSLTSHSQEFHMKTQANVQHALMCLEALAVADQPLSVEEISRHQGVPFDECRDLLDRMTQAGFVQETEEGYALVCEVESLTALDVLQALWYPPRHDPEFQLWIGAEKRVATHVTLQAIAAAPLVLTDGGYAA